MKQSARNVLSIAGIVVLAIAMSWRTDVLAQDAIVGTYSGGTDVMNPLGDVVRLGLKLEISRVDGGKVTATATRYMQGPCAGTYPMAGIWDGATLKMRAVVKGGHSGDCGFAFTATREGNKFVGKLPNGYAIEFSR